MQLFICKEDGWLFFTSVLFHFDEGQECRYNLTTRFKVALLIRQAGMRD